MSTNIKVCIGYVVKGEPLNLPDGEYALVPIAATQAPSAPVDVCAQMRALCSACGGTGDVHTIDGEWRGSCDCQASAPVATDERALLAARAEGRAEAVLMIMAEDPEDCLNDCMVGSGPCPASGEYDTHWDEEKLRAKFSAGDSTINMETKAEMAYYEYLGARMELEYEADQRRAALSVKVGARVVVIRGDEYLVTLKPDNGVEVVWKGPYVAAPTPPATAEA